MKIEFTVNGNPHSVEADPRETLLFVLRERLGLMGTKYGCGEGECGACTVLLNERHATSCLVLAGQAHGADIVTIEGMQADPIGRHVVSAFVEHGAVQCGFCTPGMVISTRALLAQNSQPGVDEIKTGLGGNLCRCTGYTKIFTAVQAAGQRVKAPDSVGAGNGASLASVQDPGFLRPAALDDALAVLADDSGWRIIGGMTDAGVQNEHRMKTTRWLDLSIVPEINTIREDDEAVIVGGGVKFTDIIQSPLLNQWAQPLVQAAREVGAVQVQNRATLAGNLINASPAADSVPALFVLEASVVLQSTGGRRVIPVSEFASGPGKTAIAPGEILTEVLIPKKKGVGQEITFFAKLGPRKSQTISIATVAVRAWLENGRLKDVLVAMGAVGPTVLFAPECAQHLMAEPLTEERIMDAARLASQECRPIDDLRATAAYRRLLVRGLLARGLLEATPEEV
jgi:xanthine dehydrogenase small subunit